MIDPPDEQLDDWFQALHAWDQARSVNHDIEVTTLSYGDHPDQVVEVWLPSNHRRSSTVVGIHGGYFAAEYDRSVHWPISRELCHRGIAVWNVEYRKGPGAGLGPTTSDVWAAIDLAASRSVGGRVSVFGHSAGGYLAEWASPHPAVGLVLGLGAVTDLPELVRLGCDEGAIEAWLGGTPESVPTVYDAATLTSRWPTVARHLLIHGTDDRVVPPEQSIALALAGRTAGEDYEFVPLAGTGHYAFLDPRSDAFEVMHGYIVA